MVPRSRTGTITSFIEQKESKMNVRRVAVLALIGLLLPLSVVQAQTTGCTLPNLFGCLVSGSGPVGLRVTNSQTDARSLSGVNSATSGNTVGVHGQVNSPHGVGVLGQSLLNASNSQGIGVLGFTSSPNGAGVEGSSSTGFAMRAIGNTRQNRDRGGWVKALVRMHSSTLSRCYNSQALSGGDASANCNGFSISGDDGNYIITFPFQVNDRYVVVTSESVADIPRCCMVQYDFPASNQVRVRTWDQNGLPISRAFSLVIF
jgi:hypothetical protein